MEDIYWNLESVHTLRLGALEAQSANPIQSLDQMSAQRNTNCEAYRIEQAVLAERDRCAKIADAIRIELLKQNRNRRMNQFDEHVSYVCDGIAAKIRGGE